MPSNVWNFLRDPQSQSEMRNALTDSANRGMVAGSLGAPVDMATTLTNLLIAGGGYVGHKTGLLNQPPDLIDSRNVPGSSEWIGQKMQNAGAVSPNRNALAEFGMGLLSPVAYKGAQKMGGLLYNAESNALANAAKPSTMAMQGQRGAIVWHGSPHKFDKFDASKIGTGEGAQVYGRGLYFAEDKNVANSYATKLSSDGVGNMYKVDIPDAHIKNMLDWDAPIQRQPKIVKDFAAKELQDIGYLGQNHTDADMLSAMKALRRDYGEAKGASKLNGEYLHHFLAGRYGSPEKVSLALMKNGVPGVKYYDGQSRSGATKTRNIVVFPGNEGSITMLQQ